MSKYPHDLFGILRGIQLVASASLKSQEAFLKEVWSHSSVREAISNNIKQTSECGKKVIDNPAKEFQNINVFLKESFERSSVAMEGLRQYMSNSRSSFPIGAIEISEDKKSKSYSSIKNIKNLDIASITLKELENVLAEHNKIREVNLRLDENFVPKKTKDDKDNHKVTQKATKSLQDNLKEEKPEPPPSVIEDEKKVENMMKFITNYDKPVSSEGTQKVSSVLEVSNVYFIFCYFYYCELDHSTSHYVYNKSI